MVRLVAVAVFCGDVRVVLCGRVGTFVAAAPLSVARPRQIQITAERQCGRRFCVGCRDMAAEL